MSKGGVLMRTKGLEQIRLALDLIDKGRLVLNEPRRPVKQIRPVEQVIDALIVKIDAFNHSAPHPYPFAEALSELRRRLEAKRQNLVLPAAEV